MILGIGVDIVEVNRFHTWIDYPQEQLLKVFSFQELSDCNVNGMLNPEKLAARFAAKEAFYKAFSATLVQLHLTKHEFSLLFACQYVMVTATTWQVPALQIDWYGFEKKIDAKLPSLTTHLSLSHEKAMAVAYVVITCNEKK